MSSETNGEKAQDHPKAYSVDAHNAQGLQVGEHNTQIIYTYTERTRPDNLALPPLADVTGAIDSPYRGLRAFREQDAPLFFGRDDAIAEVLDRMSQLAAAEGFLIVTGASGAGKSSLLQAGILPRLRGSGLAGAPDAASWPCIFLTPGPKPLNELALRTSLVAGTDAEASCQGLRKNPAGFSLTARQAALAQPSPGQSVESIQDSRTTTEPRLILIVDQFEQIFTHCDDAEERQSFITALHAAAHRPPGGQPPALVVLGMRADFDGRCATYPELADAVQRRYLVTPMTERQLRLAITAPARQVGSLVEDELATVLLAEVRSRNPGEAGAGVLPLLSYALDQAWRSRTGQDLTLADYERTGGIEEAVAASAGRAYENLTPSQQNIAREVFMRLVATSADGLDTAGRSSLTELTGYDNPCRREDAEVVLEAFVRERLLTVAHDSVEISHEALLTAWPQLRDVWLAESRSDRIVRTRLRNDAAEWERHSRDPSYLYRGRLLLGATETVTRTNPAGGHITPLGPAERDFLAAANRASRRTRLWRRTRIASLAALTLVSVVVAGVAVSNEALAARQHAIALSRQLAAESLSASASKPVVARQLAAAAWSISPTNEAGNALTTLLTQQERQDLIPASTVGLGAVTFSPDGRFLATADNSGAIQVWNPATGQPAGVPLATDTGPSNYVSKLAFSPDGRFLAAASGNGTVQLWNPATRKPTRAPLLANTRSIHGSMIGVEDVAFSPNGKLLASADADGKVRLWNPTTGQPIGHPLPADPGDAVNGVAFSPNGKLLASADSDGTVRLWNPATREPVAIPLPADANDGVEDVAFSPNGKLLASADADGKVRLWNPTTGQPIGHPLAANLGVGDLGGPMITFSPDSRLLATAGINGTVRLWNPSTGQLAGTPLSADSGPDAGVSSVAFSHNAKLLATADEHGTVRLWNPYTGSPSRSSGFSADVNYDGGVLGVAFSPDSSLLASADSDGKIRLWNPTTGQSIRSVTSSNDENGNGVVAFSPDGKVFASVGDGTVRFWDPATGQQVRHPLPATSSLEEETNGVAFSPDSRLIASADTNNATGKGTVQLWNSVTGKPVGTPLLADPGTRNVAGGVSRVAFSPDGTLLASADANGKVRLWDTVSRQPVRSFTADSRGAIDDLAFSPDGTLLASADEYNGVRLWNPANGRPVGKSLGGNDRISSVAFSPDGKLLASADIPESGPGVVRLWNLATGRLVGAPLAASTVHGAWGVAFSPNGKLLAAAGGDGTVDVWDTQRATNPYGTFCTDVGPPTHTTWNTYAPGEPFPKTCHLASIRT